MNADHEQPILEMESNVRRLTPLECERLQGFPDNWTDIGDWVDSKGKRHKAKGEAKAEPKAEGDFLNREWFVRENVRRKRSGHGQAAKGNPTCAVLRVRSPELEARRRKPGGRSMAEPA